MIDFKALFEETSENLGHPYQAESARSALSELLLVVALVCLLTYPIDVFLTEYSATLPLRMGWFMVLILSSQAIIRRTPLQVLAISRALTTFSVVMLYLLIGITGVRRACT